MSVGPISMSFEAPAMDASLSSLAELAERFPQVCDPLLRLLDSGDELVRVERDPTGGAGKLSLLLYPSDGFLEAVAAVRAIDPDLGIVEVSCHGWPVLSVGSGTPTVAEGRGESIAPTGGDA